MAGRRHAAAEAADEDGPAQQGVRRKAVHLMVALRLTSAIAGAVVALMAVDSVARPGWTLGCVAVLLVWAAIFTAVLLRRGPLTRVLVVDVVVVAGLCLSQSWVAPAQVLRASAGTGWVDIVVSSGVFLVQFGSRQPFGLGVAVVVAFVYMVGAPGPREAPVVLVVQGLLAAVLAGLLRREARGADRELAERSRAVADAA
ncbi:hypothetical protein, partial [Actinomadura fibrosa]